MENRFRPYSKRSRKYIYEQNQQEIMCLKTRGDRLLQILEGQKTRMNRQDSLYCLNQITENMLRIISLIETYRYFQAKNELLTRENNSWFYHIANCYYLDLVEKFNTLLKNLNDIDFVIVK